MISEKDLLEASRLTPLHKAGTIWDLSNIIEVSKIIFVKTVSNKVVRRQPSSLIPNLASKHFSAQLKIGMKFLNHF